MIASTSHISICPFKTRRELRGINRAAHKQKTKGRRCGSKSGQGGMSSDHDRLTINKQNIRTATSNSGESVRHHHNFRTSQDNTLATAIDIDTLC